MFERGMGCPQIYGGRLGCLGVRSSKTTGASRANECAHRPCFNGVKWSSVQSGSRETYRWPLGWGWQGPSSEELWNSLIGAVS